MIQNEKDIITKALLMHINTDMYHITTDRKGMPNVLYTGRGAKKYIHSSYDAVKDGQWFAKTNYVSHSNLAVIGLGLGYHVKALAERLTHGQKLYVFETNLDLLKIALEVTDIRSFLQSENIILYAGSSIKDVAKFFFQCLSESAFFITYLPVMNTVPEDMNLIEQYNWLYQTQCFYQNKPLILSDVKTRVNYTPLLRAKRYKVMLIGYGLVDNIINGFVENLAIAFEYLGCEVSVISCDNFSHALSESQTSHSYDFFMSYDFFVCCDESYVGSLFDDINIPLISVRIDRPYALSGYMRNKVNNVLYTWIFQSDLKYSQLYFDHGKHSFLPHGAELNFYPNKLSACDRFLDVVISCNYFTDRVFERFAYYNQQLDADTIYKVRNHFMLSGKPLEECIKDILSKACDDEVLYQLMHDVGFAIDISVRLENRYRIVKALLESGVSIHLFGMGWELTDLVGYPNCIYHGYINHEAGREIFEHSKILINNQSAYSGAGSHERVFSAMIRGALCISNATDYLKNTFIKDKEIVLYDNNNTDKLVEKVKYYLEHEDERLIITKNAFENVRANHTWVNRADDIITMYEKFIKERDGEY